jgi:type II secretory pathway component GspD/PulD (secretin)
MSRRNAGIVLIAWLVVSTLTAIATEVPPVPKTKKTSKQSQLVELDVRYFSFDGDLPPTISKLLTPESKSGGSAKPVELAPDQLREVLQFSQAQPGVKIFFAPRLRMPLGERGQVRSGQEVTYIDSDVESDQPTIKTGFVGASLEATVTQGEPDFLKVDVLFEQTSLDGRHADGNPRLTTDTKMKTTANIRSESALVVGSQVTHRADTIETRMPVLGEIPVIGRALFAKHKPVKTTTTQFLLVRPVLLNAAP